MSKKIYHRPNCTVTDNYKIGCFAHIFLKLYFIVESMMDVPHFPTFGPSTHFPSLGLLLAHIFFLCRLDILNI